MENTFYVTLLAKCPMVWQIVMFFFAGISIELVLEFIKASVKQTKGKCPSWFGMLLGIIGTLVYLSAAYSAQKKLGDGWYIPGGTIFVWVWFILFFFYQFKAISIAKPIFKKFCPYEADPNYVKPIKVKKDKKESQEDILKKQIEEVLASMEKKEN